MLWTKRAATVQQDNDQNLQRYLLETGLGQDAQLNRLLSWKKALPSTQRQKLARQVPRKVRTHRRLKFKCLLNEICPL